DDHQTELSPEIRFRWFDYFEDDLLNAGVPVPSVIFIEPDYTDIPFLHTAPPNDDHPPASVDAGQRFLRKIYRAVTRNPEVWKRTVMIVAYDEHGGFFDHVQPPAITTPPPAGAVWNEFLSLGVRVPAFLVSPYVEAGSVVSQVFDHTSILKLI